MCYKRPFCILDYKDDKMLGGCKSSMLNKSDSLIFYLLSILAHPKGEI